MNICFLSRLLLLIYYHLVLLFNRQRRIMYKEVGVKRRKRKKVSNLSGILAGHVGASSSGGTGSAHGRDRLRNSSSRSNSTVVAVDGGGLVHVLLVHGDGAVVGVHGWDLGTSCCGSGAGACHGALDVGLVMAIVLVSHQTSTRGRVDLLSSSGGWGHVLVVGWHVARTRGASGCWVLKTADVGGLLVRDDGRMDQIGICGVGAAKGRGMMLVLVMLVLVTEKTMMVGVVVLGWDSGSGMTGKAVLTTKRVLVSGTVDCVPVGDGSITNSSAGMHRHGRRLGVLVMMTILGVQGIDGVLTSMVGGRGVGAGSAASIAWELVVGSMESRTGLVRVVVDVGVVGVVLPAGELIGDLGNLLLDLVHGRGLDGLDGLDASGGV